MGRDGLDAEQQNNWRRTLRRPLTLLGGSVLLVALVAGVLSATSQGSGGAVSAVGHKSVADALTGYKHCKDDTDKDCKQTPPSLHYTISGNATKPLAPGVDSKIDLSFTNPNSQSITVPATAITITIGSRKGCPASPNFRIVHTLTASITLPGNTTRSLSTLGVTRKDWPVITMVTTHVTQDACIGTFRLYYSTGDDR
jgi:hypothetical protein